MKKLLSLWPFYFILGVWIVLFFPFFSKGLIPMPADIITGVYYPWLDYKWGFSTGVPVKNPLLSDIPSLLYPWRSFVIDQLKNGQWPLWNPYYFAGMPLLANFQSAVFSYVNIFFVFFSKPIAWSLGVMTSSLLTMLIMYIFLRHKNLSKTSSTLGGVIFAFSGFEIAWMEYNVHGHTALFLPLFLLSIDKILNDNSKIWLLLLPIFVAFQIFAGYVPIVIYSYLICFFYTIYFYLIPGIKEKNILFKRYLLLLTFFILGLFLSSIQILPGIELVANSIRKVDTLVSASNASYLPLKNLVTFLAPDFFGNPATGNYFGNAFYDNFYLFIGTGTLILIIFSLFHLKDKIIIFWCSIFLISLILIFKNPIGQFLERILFLSGGVSARALFISDFSLAILSALGFEKLVLSRSKLKIFLSIFIVLIIFFLCTVYSFSISEKFRLVSQRNLVIPLIFLILCASTLLIGIKHKKANFLILFLITVQLIYSAKKYLPFSKEKLLFPSTPVIEFLQSRKNEEGPFRVELGEVVPQNFMMPYGIETISGYDALMPKEVSKLLSTVETGKIQQTVSRVYLLRNFNSPILPLLNIKYVFAKKIDEKGYYSPQGKVPDIFTKYPFKLIFEDKTVQLYERTDFLQRANFIKSEKFPDKSTDVVTMIQSQKIKNDAKIKWISYGANKKSFSVETDVEGYVFLSDSYFPGWQVRINNKNSDILNKFSMQSIFVPSGKNIVSLEYRPNSFKLGKTITQFSFVGWLLSLLIFSKRFLWKKRGF